MSQKVGNAFSRSRSRSAEMPLSQAEVIDQSLHPLEEEVLYDQGSGEPQEDILTSMSNSVAQSGLLEEEEIREFTPLEKLLNDNKYIILSKIYQDGMVTYYLVRTMYGNVVLIQVAEPMEGNPEDILAMEAQTLERPYRAVDVGMVRGLLECQNDAICSLASVCGDQLCFTNTQSLSYPTSVSQTLRLEGEEFNGARLGNSPMIYPVVPEDYIVRTPMKAHKELYKISRRLNESMIKEFNKRLDAYSHDVDRLKKAIEGTKSYLTSTYAVDDVLEADRAKLDRSSFILTDAPNRAAAELKAASGASKSSLEKSWNLELNNAMNQKVDAISKLMERQNMAKHMLARVDEVLATRPKVQELLSDINHIIDPQAVKEAVQVAKILPSEKVRRGLFGF